MSQQYKKVLLPNWWVTKCEGCGVAVLDQAQHDLFHEKTRSKV